MNILLEKYGVQRTNDEILEGFKVDNKHVEQEVVDVLCTVNSLEEVDSVVVGPSQEDITVVVTEKNKKLIPLVVINTLRAICKRTRITFAVDVSDVASPLKVYKKAS